jgi:uncharacterized Zn finger protein (UPF0148 family)
MADPRIACPNCNKTYRWQSKIAGRMVRCGCGQKFRVPMTAGGVVEPVGPSPSPPTESAPPARPGTPAVPPPGSAPAQPTAPEPDPYELDLPDALKASAAAPSGAQAGDKCPACNTPLRAGAVICLNCGYNLAEGSKIQTVVDATAGDGSDDETRPRRQRRKQDEADDTVPEDQSPASRAAARTKLDEEIAADTARKHHFQENVLPLILIGAGLALLLFNAFFMSPRVVEVWGFGGGGSPWLDTLIASVMLLAIQIPCLLAGLFAIAALFGSAFGSLGTAMKKLVALALAGGQFDVLLDLFFAISMGPVAFFAIFFQLAVSFAVFWAIAKQLFEELEPGETISLWLMMSLLPGWILGFIDVFFFS